MRNKTRKNLAIATLNIGALCFLGLPVLSCQPHTERARRVEPLEQLEVTESSLATDITQNHEILYESATEAFGALLQREKNAEVIGFGEHHQRKGSAPGIPSSLSRFTGELLPHFRGKATDLIIETWVASDKCGSRAERVVEDVQETTQRPNETEQEIIAMIRAAQSIGVQPGILEMGCSDYEAVFSGEEVDYDQLLQVLTRLIREQVDRVRAARTVKAGASSLVLIYGGSIHNDLYPEQEVAAYSYGPGLSKALDGRYLEVDLFVPEYIEGDQNLSRQEWYPTFLEHQSEGQVMLLERGPSSYVMIFKRAASS